MQKELQVQKVDAAISKTASGAFKKVVAFGFICALVMLALSQTPAEQKFAEVLVATLVGSATFCMGALMAATCFKSYIRLPTADLAENKPMSKADRLASMALVAVFVLVAGLVAFVAQMVTMHVTDSGFQFAVLGSVFGAWWMVATFLAHFDEHEKMLNGWREE